MSRISMCALIAVVGLTLIGLGTVSSVFGQQYVYVCEWVPQNICEGAPGECQLDSPCADCVCIPFSEELVCICVDSSDGCVCSTWCSPCPEA